MKLLESPKLVPTIAGVPFSKICWADVKDYRELWACNSHLCELVQLPKNVQAIWLIAYSCPAKDRICVSDLYEDDDQYGARFDGCYYRLYYAPWEICKTLLGLREALYVECWYEE